MHDYSLPHEVGEFVFATDACMAVRVRPILADAFHHTSDRVPPFSSLPWDRSKLIWRPTPKLDLIVARDSPCPKCDGAGYWPKPPEDKLVTCASCFGEGCHCCNDRGPFADAYECSMCHGKGLGKFPSIVKVGDCYAPAKLYEKFHRLDGEYAIDANGFGSSLGRERPLIRFRFADGTGMLLPLDHKRAIQRIEAQ